MKNLKIILVDVNAAVVSAWERHCEGLAEIHHGSILDVEADAYVSPANSFGFMDGGIDAVYERHYPGTQDRTQWSIGSFFNGEMPVGAADFVTLIDPAAGEGKKRTRALIVAPTMRVPQRLPSDSVNAYLAAKAALWCAHSMSGPFETTIAIPGLGTGVGGMDPDVSAWQIANAIREYQGQYQAPKTWMEAVQRQMELTRPPEISKAANPVDRIPHRSNREGGGLV